MIVYKIGFVLTVFLFTFVEKKHTFKISYKWLENGKTTMCGVSVNNSEQNSDMPLTVGAHNSCSKGARVPRQRRAGVAFKKKVRQEGFRVSTPKESPHSVLLAMLNKAGKYEWVCSGSLLTTQWVLTAARCFKDHGEVRRVLVYAGGNSKEELLGGKYAGGSQHIYSSEIVVHPEYRRDLNTKRWQHNLALVKTETEFMLSNTVKTVTIPLTPWTYRGYTSCSVTGYGRLQHNVTKYPAQALDYSRKTYLLEVRLPCQCGLVVKKKPVDNAFAICAKFQEDFGICDGDEGAGLLCQGKLLGVASAYIMMMPEQFTSGRCNLERDDRLLECATMSTLSTFENLHPHLAWINKYTTLYAEKDIPTSTSKPDKAAAACLSFTWWLLVLLTYSIFAHFNCDV